MTHKSIKLLALAVIYGCSLIALAIVPRDPEIRVVIMLAISLLIGIWFLIYWILCDERQR